MIHDYVIIGIAVLFSVMVLVMIGQKLKVAYPIFLVISGLIISLVPGMEKTVKLTTQFRCKLTTSFGSN